MQKYVPGVILSVALLGIAGCSSSSDSDSDVGDQTTTAATTSMDMSTTSAGSSSDEVATVALASSSGSTVTGNLEVTPSEDGVMIMGTVVGLEPNTEHGFHIHETGDCSAPDASSAGGHFNPTDEEHGRAGEEPHHAGDSDNLVADADGVAEVHADFVGVTLGDGGPEDVLGRAVVVHANPDDYVTQPAGDAGDRVACGVITAE